MKTGVAFPDYISNEKGSSHRKLVEHEGRFSEGITFRWFMLLFCLLVCVVLLIGKLFSLQIFQGAYFRTVSDANRLRTTLIHAPRGVIFDRNGKPLVYNLPGFRRIEEGKTVVIQQDEALSLLAKGNTHLEIDSLRQYPNRDSMSHVLGYIGQIDEDTLKNPQFASYNGNDLVGKSGIEQVYEHMLKGNDGKELIEVDAMGKRVRTLGKTDPIPGQDITLTLDTKLQAVAYDALKDAKRGVVIVSTPNGEILAMVSKPSFDPNLFTLGAHYKPATDSAYPDVTAVITDGDNQPLLNRAISGTFPPGSTFKLVTAASGLENKIIDENYTVEDTGVLKVGTFSFANWYFTGYGRTDGAVNVVKAIKRSNDIFFYKLAEIVGVDRLSAMSRKFGLGEKTGIDLVGEAKGLVPDPEWKKKILEEPWYLGDNYNYGIGQGYLLTTPLQVNMLTSVIANKGTLYTPHLIKSQKSRPEADQPLAEKIKDQKLLQDKTIGLIRQGMEESCSPGGVAWPLFEFKVKNEKLKVYGRDITEVAQSTTSADFKDYRHIAIACKTGTAQHGGEKTLPHAWITLFAPVEKPQIVVTVLVEESGEGSSIAAPVAKKVVEEWFSR